MSLRVLIVGSEWAGKTLANAVLASKKYSLVGFIDDKFEQGHQVEQVSDASPKKEISILGPSKALLKIAKNYQVKTIIIAVAHRPKDHLLSQIVKCHEAGIHVRQFPEVYGELTGKIPITFIDHEWIIPRLKEPEPSLSSVSINLLDSLISYLLLLFVFVPSFPILALLIKLSSSGPIFFYQKRIGYKGKRFTIIKYRTMIHLARKQGASWTTQEDNRITLIGRFMRKFRIDELPQLLNIMKGDMALVGPRPEAVDLVVRYRKEIPFYEYRYLVKPGISGWAQSLYKNTCSVEGALTKLQYDLFWIRHRNLRNYLFILFKTFKVVITGYGSV